MGWNETQTEDSGISYTEWNDMVSFMLGISSNAIYFSSNANNLYADSSNVRLRFQASSLARQSYLHSANSSIHSFSTSDYITSTNSISRFADSSNINRTLLNTISSNLDSRIDNLFSWSSNALTLYGASSHSHDDLYYTETEIDDTFYTKTWIDTFSGNVDTRIDALGGFDQTNYITSANAIIRFYPSTEGHYFTGSGAKLTSAYLSANRVLDLFNHNLYPISTNIYNRDWIDTLSGSIDTRLDTLEGTSFDHTEYIVSTNAIERFADSSNFHIKFVASSVSLERYNEYVSFSSNKGLYFPSSLGKSLYDFSANKTLYADSSNVRFRFPASSTAIEKYYPSTLGHSLYDYSANKNKVFESVSSQGRISGQWWTPLYNNLTDAGAASTRPGQIIRTSGNSDGTWVWISIYGGSSYNWMQLTYLTGV